MWSVGYIFIYLVLVPPSQRMWISNGSNKISRDSNKWAENRIRKIFFHPGRDNSSLWLVSRNGDKSSQYSQPLLCGWLFITGTCDVTMTDIVFWSLNNFLKFLIPWRMLVSASRNIPLWRQNNIKIFTFCTTYAMSNIISKFMISTLVP